MKEEKIVYLRKFKLNDAENLLKEFKAPEIIKQMELEINVNELTINKEKRWLEKTIAEYNESKPRNINLAIIKELDVRIEIKDNCKERRLEELVGGIGMHTIDYNKNEAEICYWIGKTHQGKGYATDAIKLFCEKLFECFNFCKIKADVSENNIASQRALEKSGFCIDKGGCYYELKNPYMNNKIRFRGVELRLSERGMRG